MSGRGEVALRRAVLSIFLAYFIISSSVIIGTAQGGSDNQGWTTEGGNPQSSGLSPYNTTNLGDDGSWTFWTTDLEGSCPYKVFEGLRVGPDGTIYTTFNDGGHNTYNGLLALNPDGTIKWTVNTTVGMENARDNIGVGSDGTVYCMVNVAQQPNPDPVTGVQQFSREYIIRALSPINGSMLWEYAPPGGFYRYPFPMVVSPNGQLILSSDESIIALHPNGTEVWRAQVPALDMCFAIASDGTVIAVSHRGYLYAIEPNGTTRWNVTISSSILHYIQTLVLDSVGNIYIVADNYEDLTSILMKYSPNGTLEWNFHSEGCSLNWQPAIDRQGNIYFGFRNLTRIDTSGSVKEVPGILSLDPNGNLRWVVRLSTGGLAMSADGILYGAGSDGFFALRSDGTLLWQMDLLHSPYPSFDMPFMDSADVAIGPDGTVYFSGEMMMTEGTAGYVLAIRGTPSVDDPGLVERYLIPLLCGSFIAALLVLLFIVRRRGGGLAE